MEEKEYLQTLGEQILNPHARTHVLEEIQEHIDEQMQDYIDTGMSPDAAEKEAVRQMGTGFIRTELARIFFTDLYEGSRRAAVYAKAGDASDYLDQWLGRYGSIEELQQLVEKLRFTP